MNKSECFVGQIVHFTCNGKGRGGHYGVTATVSKINRSNALLIEAPRSYRPGTNWICSIEKLRSAEQDRARMTEMLEALKADRPELFEGLK